MRERRQHVAAVRPPRPEPRPEPSPSSTAPTAPAPEPSPAPAKQGDQEARRRSASPRSAPAKKAARRRRRPRRPARKNGCRKSRRRPRRSGRRSARPPKRTAKKRGDQEAHGGAQGRQADRRRSAAPAKKRGRPQAGEGSDRRRSARREAPREEGDATAPRVGQAPRAAGPRRRRLQRRFSATSCCRSCCCSSVPNAPSRRATTLPAASTPNSHGSLWQAPRLDGRDEVGAGQVLVDLDVDELDAVGVLIRERQQIVEHRARSTATGSAPASRTSRRPACPAPITCRASASCSGHGGLRVQIGSTPSGFATVGDGARGAACADDRRRRRVVHLERERRLTLAARPAARRRSHGPACGASRFGRVDAPPLREAAVVEHGVAGRAELHLPLDLRAEGELGPAVRRRTCRRRTARTRTAAASADAYRSLRARSPPYAPVAGAGSSRPPPDPHRAAARRRAPPRAGRGEERRGE